MARASRIVFVVSLLLPGSAATSAACAGEIHRLIESGEVEKAEALLVKNPELIQEREPELKQMPLHIAAQRGHLALVKYLIDHGADVNARAYNRFTPLHLAHDPDIAKLLIEHKADLEARDAWGTTKLQDCAGTCAGNEKKVDVPERKIIKLLLDAGASYDIQSAVLLGDLERVRTILKKDPQKVREEGVVHFATRYNHATITKLLLEYKADFANAYWQDTPAVYFALEYAEMVRLYLQAGVDPKAPLKYKEPVGFRTGPPRPRTSDKITLLHCAAGEGHLEAAKILLEAGAPVNARTARDETPLHWAALGGRPDIVKLLLKNKATIEGKDGSRAMAAAARGIRAAEWRDPPEWTARHREVIKLLHEHHVPYDLFAAIVVGDTDRVKALLKENPALATSKEGDELEDSPALHRAVDLDQKEIVALLLDAGAPISAKDWRESTALHEAAGWGREGIVKLLIERKADVNAADDRGCAPLHNTVWRSNVAVARLLLDAGANVNAKDNQGRTPLSWARDRQEKPNPAFVKLLQDRGGKE
jgi:ankyrin repeat protein